jgi:hypothetical protein
VTNVYGVTGSRRATLTVFPNQPPIPQILVPTEGKKWKGNQFVTLKGSATDPEDGDLPASAFAWRVDLVRDGQSTSVVTELTGTSTGSFRTITRAETSTDLLYRITLTVTDSSGTQTSVVRDIYPIKSNLTLQTNIPGVPITLDGQSVANPSTTLSIVAVHRTISVPQTFQSEGVTYTFQSWSDGRARTHDIAVPTLDTTLTGTYTATNSPPTGAAKSSSGGS